MGNSQSQTCSSVSDSVSDIGTKSEQCSYSAAIPNSSFRSCEKSVLETQEEFKYEDNCTDVAIPMKSAVPCPDVEIDRSSNSSDFASTPSGLSNADSLNSQDANHSKKVQAQKNNHKKQIKRKPPNH